MPSDDEIALQVKPVQIPDPMEAMARIQAIKSGQTNQLLHQQELQSNQQTQQFNALKMAEYQKQTQGENTEGDLVKANTKYNPDGTATTDHAAVSRSLMQQGLVKQSQAYDARVALNNKADRDATTAGLANQHQEIQNGIDKTKANQEQIALAGQLSNSVVEAARGIGDGTQPQPGQTLTSPENYEKVYQNSYNTGVARGIIDPTAKPGDPKYMPPSGLNPDKTINMDTLQVVRGHAADAITSEKAHTNHQSDLEFAQKGIEFQQKVHTEAPKTQAAWLDLGGQLLGGAKTDQQQQAGLALMKQAGASPEILALYDKSYLPATNSDAGSAARAAALATTAPQASRKANSDARLKQAQDRIEKDTAAGHKQYVSQLADQVVAESATGGGGGIDNALANVDPKNGFYGGDHPVNQFRGEVQAELQRRKVNGPGGLNQTKLQNSLDTAEESRKLLKEYHIDAPAPQAAPPTPQGKTPPAKTAAPKFSEAAVRERVKAKGGDDAAADAAVKGLRDKGQIQ